MNATYELITDFKRPDPALVARAAPLYYCLVGGLVGPRYVMDPGIKPLDTTASPPWRVCGPAFTVRPEYADDVLMGQIAGKYVKPGDVVVVDACGSRMAAFGASMANGLKVAGAAGLVLDGYVLTAEVINERENIPVFCRGTVSISGEGTKPGWLNVPVICGGVIVNPGDLILGDADGVVVVPQNRIADVVAKIESNSKPRSRDGSIAARATDAPMYYKKCGADDKIAALAASQKLKIT